MVWKDTPLAVSLLKANFFVRMYDNKTSLSKYIRVASSTPRIKKVQDETSTLSGESSLPDRLIAAFGFVTTGKSGVTCRIMKWQKMARGHFLQNAH
jgi:hypothetical protein